MTQSDLDEALHGTMLALSRKGELSNEGVFQALRLVYGDAENLRYAVGTIRNTLCESLLADFNPNGMSVTPRGMAFMHTVLASTGATAANEQEVFMAHLDYLEALDEDACAADEWLDEDNLDQC